MTGRKIVIAPCMGVGRIVANVTRRAACLIVRKYPAQTALLSLPALLAGDAEQCALVQDNPVIFLDGCGQRCAAHIFYHLGVNPVAKIEVGHLMAETKLGPGKTRQQLDEIGRKLADVAAGRIKRIMRNKKLLQSFKPAAGLRRAAPAMECARGRCTGAKGTKGTKRTKGITAPQYVTVFPCQGIRRAGGRVTQRAGYHLVEELFPGKTLLLCVPALAAGVLEDVEMLSQFPTVALNGCGRRCASVIAARHGVPAAATVDLDAVVPAFKGERILARPDLTVTEAQAAVKLAAACCPAIKELLAGTRPWQPGQCALLGMVNQPATINAAAGFKKCADGYMIRSEA